MAADLTPEQSEYISNFIETLMAGKNCPHCREPIIYKRQVGCCVYASPCGCRLYHGNVDLEPREQPTVSFDLKTIPKGSSQAQARENVSYAVGDPYGVFDHIPHTVNSDGSVTLDQNAIEAMWRATHKWEPLEDWRGPKQASGENWPPENDHP